MAADKRKLTRNALNQVKKGQIVGAVKTYKAIQELDPDDVKVHNTLGDLHIRLSQKEEATREYLWVADYYEREGLLSRSVAICQKLLKLFPEMAEVRLRLADLFSRQNFAAEAKKQLLLACDYYEENGKVDEVLNACSKLADLDPDNLQFRIRLGSRCEKQGRPAKAAREYSIVAEGLIKKGSVEEAGELLDKAMEVSPDTADPRLVKARLLALQGEWNEAAENLAPLATTENADMQVLKNFAGACLKAGRVAEAIETLEKAQETESSSFPLKTLLGRAYLAGREIAKAQSIYGPLIEGFLKEKKLEAAEDLARQISEADPSSEDGLRQLLDVVKRRGDKKGIKAIGIMLDGLRVEERDNEGGGAPVDNIPEPFPGAAAATDEAEEAKEAEEAEEAEETEETEEEFLDVDIEALDLHEEGVVGAVDAVALSAIEEKEHKELLVEADFYMKQGLTDEAEHLYQKLKKLVPGNVGFGEHLERLRGDKTMPIVRSELEAFESDLVRAPGGAPPSDEGSVKPTVGGVDDGDDMFESSDLLSDLKDVLEGVVPEPVKEARGEQSLREFFKKHLAGIEEEMGEQDSEAHYNRGVAFKDMGLVQEAIEEFRLSEKRQVRQIDSISMIARCLLETGDVEEAAAKLEEGIILSMTGSDEEKGFWYDLADIHLHEGREEEALEIFQQLYDLDPEYRDVAERIG